MAKTKKRASIRKLCKAIKLQGDKPVEYFMHFLTEKRTQEIQIDYVLNPEKYVDYAKLDMDKLYMRGANQ